MSSFFLDQATSQRYLAGIPFTYGEMNYTAAGATADTFKSLGFIEVQVQPRPDDRYYINNSYPKDDGSWDSQPRDLAELKKGLVTEQNTQQGSILSSTDWLITRKQETGKDIPAEIAAYRTEVRRVGDLRVAAVEAVSSLDELQALELEPWPDAEPKPVQKRASSTRK